MSDARCKNFCWFNQGECAVQCGTTVKKAIKQSQKKREEIVEALLGVTLPPNGIYYCSTCLPNRPVYHGEYQCSTKSSVQKKPTPFEMTYCRNLFCNELSTSRSSWCPKHEEEYELVNERKRQNNRAFPLFYGKPHLSSADLPIEKRSWINQAKSSECSSSSELNDASSNITHPDISE